MVSESGRFVEVVSDNTHASWVRALGGGRPLMRKKSPAARRAVAAQSAMSKVSARPPNASNKPNMYNTYLSRSTILTVALSSEPRMCLFRASEILCRLTFIQRIYQAEQKALLIVLAV